MEMLLDKFFRNDKTMIISYVLIIVCNISQFIQLFCVYQDVSSYPVYLTLNVSTILFSTIIVFTYKSHDINIMKSAVGMLIGAIIVYSMNVSFRNLFIPELLESYTTTGIMGYISLILEILQFALLLVFGMIHLALNKSHDSSKKILIANKIIVISLYAVYLIMILSAIPIFEYEIGQVIFLVEYYVIFASIITLIASIESRVDFFK